MRSALISRQRSRTIGILFLTGLALSAVSSGCATGVTRDGLIKLMQEGSAPLLVDVRSQGEYDRDHVPGAVHIPFFSVVSGLRELGYPKTEPVVLYCEHGPRSGIASLSLSLYGYEKIYSLEGHMKGWRANGYPLEIPSPPLHY
jgi:rhodanese-related sulfurtransferase